MWQLQILSLTRTSSWRQGLRPARSWISNNQAPNTAGRPRGEAVMASHPDKYSFRDMIPALDGAGKNHKGQHGKVFVIGGNAEFAGAPYYAAYSAMQVGADYGNVFCTPGAAAAIKCYSPELVVHPCMLELADITPGWETVSVSNEVQQAASQQALRAVEPWLSRATCLVVGPGLGKDPVMVRTVFGIMQEARRLGLPMVVDADGIGVVCLHPELVQGCARLVITPNAPEFWRLCDVFNVDHGRAEPSETPELVQALAQRMEGPVVVAKGSIDTICAAKGAPRFARGRGCPRRCGGQGDVLSGTLATAVSWASGYSQALVCSLDNGDPEESAGAEVERECLMEAAVSACELVRQAQEIAFSERQRSMVASDVVSALHRAVAIRWGPSLASSSPWNHSG